MIPKKTKLSLSLLNIDLKKLDQFKENKKIKPF